VVTFDINISTVTITLPVTGDTTPDSPDSFQVSLGNVVGAALGSTTTAQGEVTGAGAGAGAGGDTGSGTGSGSGQVLTSSGSSATLTGGAGDDTLYAGQGPDVLTGGAGADSFVFKAAPWNAGHITDFTVGTDKLDLSALFSASGYSGTDPIRDGYVSLSADGSGGTKVYYDSDGFGTGNTIQVLVTDMDHVSPSGLTWAQLSGGASTGGGTGTPPQIAFSTPSVSLAEGDTGTTAFSYTVSRSGDTSAASSVSWAVSGSGTNPANAADFQGGVLPSGTLSFAAGETSKTVVVSVVGDTTVEPDETFTVTLSGATGATLGTATVAGTITNDDGASSGGGSSGQVLTSSTYGATLTGGSGDDTLNAGQGPDVLTGGAGGDSFVFKATPWNAGHVTDFTVGTDKLDLSALFSASGYTGTDPIGDGYVSLSADGSGGTKVYYDTDGPSSGNTIQFLITDLDHVATSGLTWAQLSGGASSGGGTGGGGGATPGQVLTSSTYGATLTGGAGNDTLNAGQGPDVLTGAGGADRFVFQNPPWNAGHITDFTPGTDVLDLRGLFAQSGYTGANPLADNWLQFQSDGQGDTKVYVDMDGPNGSQWPTLVTTLDHVTPSQLGASDWIFH
jgi:Ca2+-binding RTX toxin-like protein